MRILFWDIDGTLLRTGRASLHAFQQLAKDNYGKDFDYSLIQTAGMTDCYIVGQILELILERSPTEAECMAFIKQYEEIIPSFLADRQGQLMPNVQAVLAYFSERQDVISLLLTGNTAKGAQAKLDHFGISHYFDFSASAFGDNCVDRSALAAQALKMAVTCYPAITPENIFVIGDTPNDITCGKAIDAKTVAVATGRYSLPELLAHAPWWAIAELPSPAEFANRLLGK